MDGGSCIVLGNEYTNVNNKTTNYNKTMNKYNIVTHSTVGQLSVNTYCAISGDSKQDAMFNFTNSVPGEAVREGRAKIVKVIKN